MSMETTMDAAESQPILDPQPLQDNPKQLVTLGKNDQVPLEEIWREADPACRFCTRGIQQVSGGPRRVCGCAVRNIMRRRHGQTPHAPLAKVVKTPAGEEHARVKLERLQRAADTQRAEIEERERGYDAGVDEAMVAVEEEGAKMRRAEFGYREASDSVKAEVARWVNAVREHEARESELRTYEAAARKRWDEQEEACTAASKALEAVKFRAQRRLDDTAGARARLEKLERRICIHRAAHPELEGEATS